MTKKIFQKIQSDDNIQEVIQSAFDIKLNISGGWGYTQDDALIIHDTNSVALAQLEHTLASMRAHLEMSMTLPKQERYGAINLNEIKRETLKTKTKTYAIITYQISAMLEEVYAAFIEEYKQNQDSMDFDLNDHFKRRKEHTLLREVPFWFDVTDITS